MHLKMDGWNTFSFPFGAKGLFAGVFADSFRASVCCNIFLDESSPQSNQLGAGFIWFQLFFCATNPSLGTTKTSEPVPIKFEPESSCARIQLQKQNKIPLSLRFLLVSILSNHKSEIETPTQREAIFSRQPMPRRLSPLTAMDRGTENSWTIGLTFCGLG